ncbi:MAG: hypothetical protein AB7T49_08375 [Oligoflexales bacterium]
MRLSSVLYGITAFLVCLALYKAIRRPGAPIESVLPPSKTHVGTSLPLPSLVAPATNGLTDEEEALRLKITDFFNKEKYHDALALAEKTLGETKLSMFFREWLVKQMPTLNLASGWQYLKEDNCQKAIEMFDASLKLSEINQAWKGLSICYYKTEKLPLAKQALEKYLETDTKDWSAHLYLSEILESLGMFEQAAKTLGSLASLNPAPPEIDAESIKKRLASMRAKIQESGLQVTATSEHVTLTYRAEEHEPYVNTTLQILEEAISEYIADWNFSNPSRAVEVVLYSDNNFQNVVSYGPAWAQGLFDGRIRVPISTNMNADYLKKILRHELVHALLADKTGGKSVPTWFNEGLAQFLECAQGCMRRKSQLGTKMLPNAAFDAPFTSLGFSQAKLAYAQSLFLVQTIYLEYNTQSLPPINLIVQSLNSQSDVTSDHLLHPAGINFAKLHERANTRILRGFR